jgi:uncharacterized protein (DUF1499 family)
MGGAQANLRRISTMARRPNFGDEPMSRLALWSSRLAWFALAVAALSIIIVRSGLLEIVPALTTFAASLVLAGLAILLAFAAFVVIWRQGLRGLGRALLGLLLGVALLAYPAYLGYRASRLPAISDITTDPANPPRFDVLARLRPRGSDAYPGARVAALQRAAYPDIVPLQVDVPPRMAYDIALKLAIKRKWHVVDARPPVPGRRDGVIEAVARTMIMGFRDDIVVRVRAAGRGSRIDVRSASRYGVSDFGANAKRVAALLADIDDAMSDAITRPPPPEPKNERKNEQNKRPQSKRPKR